MEITKMGHTPTPWERWTMYDGKYGIGRISNNRHDVDIVSQSIQRRVDADFIIKAVNCFNRDQNAIKRLVREKAILLNELEKLRRK